MLHIHHFFISFRRLYHGRLSLSTYLASRYGESKFANVLHAKELTTRCAVEGQNVIAISVHPGAILDTSLKRHFSFLMAVSFFRNLSVNTFYHFAFASPSKNIEQGSATTLFATLSPDIIPGAYYEDCHLSAHLNPRAADQDLATKLWEASEVAVALK
jgi:retinol dehydrogenase 12